MARTLRIFSANLWNGGADAQALADQLLALGVDVAGFQELAPEQAEAIASVMPHGELQPRRDHNGMGIGLARPAEMDRAPLFHRSGFVARLDPTVWTGLEASVEIVALHIMAPQVVRPRPAPITRHRQVRDFLRYCEDRSAAHRAVVGDFNATPLWPAYRRIASQFTDAAEEAARMLGTRPLPTWGPWPSAPRMLRIDHGFVAGMRVVDFQVVPVRGSDHSAIVMDVEPDVR